MYKNTKKIIILDYEINECIKQYHNGLLYGHPKITATIEIVQKNYYFFKMKHHVMKYITKCMQYQKTKHSIHNVYSKMQVMELLDVP